MIEKTVLTYLMNHLNVPCYMEEPDKKDKSYVLVEKTGSSRDNHLNRATIALQSYGRTMSEAAKLNELIKHNMDGIVVLDEISGSHLNSDYNFTDTETDRYRYQAVYDVLFYEED